MELTKNGKNYVLEFLIKLMYQEYEELAEMNGYPFRVVELYCSDLEHLKHYNKRSHKFLLKP